MQCFCRKILVFVPFSYSVLFETKRKKVLFFYFIQMIKRMFQKLMTALKKLRPKVRLLQKMTILVTIQRRPKPLAMQLK